MIANKITVFASSERRENEAVYAALDRLGVEFVVNGSTKLLEDHLTLPFIDIPPGDRYFGVKEIEGYVEKQIKDRQELTA